MIETSHLCRSTSWTGSSRGGSRRKELSPRGIARGIRAAIFTVSDSTTVQRRSIIIQIELYGEGTTYLNFEYSSFCLMPSMALIELAIFVKLWYKTCIRYTPRDESFYHMIGSWGNAHLTKAQFFSLSKLTSSISPYWEKSCLIRAWREIENVTGHRLDDAELTHSSRLFTSSNASKSSIWPM